jgi:glycosyltransferase involved in cell wall biosynthesis
LKKIHVLTRYNNLGASSRVRFFQYLSLFPNDIEIKRQSFFDNEYVRNIYSNKGNSLLSLLGFYFNRISYLLFKIKSSDTVWFEKELVPFFPAIFERLLSLKGVRLIGDFDDAIFHNYDESNWFIIRFFLGNKIKVVIRKSDDTIVGNNYLRGYAITAGAKNVHLVPSTVPHNKYIFSAQSQDRKKILICWIGTPYTQKYLIQLADVFCKLFNKYKGSVKLVAIGGSDKLFDYFDKSFCKVVEWSEDTEAKNVAKCDVGIMPLPNAPWERGKCGYKLIQYMASGLAVIGSDVGVNREIIESSNSGFVVESEEQWFKYLDLLIGNQALRSSFRSNSLSSVANTYSIESQINTICNVVLK